MKFTGLAKGFITLVILTVLGYVAYHYRDSLSRKDPRETQPAVGPDGGGEKTSSATLAALPASASGVLTRIRERKVLTVGMEPDAPPLHFINENRQEDGFDFQMAARIAGHLGADRVRVVEADYEKLPELLLKGEIDIIYDLVYQINQALDQIRGSDKYAELMKTYLSSTSEAFMKPIAGRRTHTVRSGDTLSKIATKELGRSERWEEIWNLNTDRVANPNLIYPGLVLLLP